MNITEDISLSSELNMLRVVYDFLDNDNKDKFLESLGQSSYKPIFNEFFEKNLFISNYDKDYLFISIVDPNTRFFLPKRHFNKVRKNLIYLANNQKYN